VFEDSSITVVVKTPITILVNFASIISYSSNPNSTIEELSKVRSFPTRID
jgi:hypothetical protein